MRQTSLYTKTRKTLPKDEVATNAKLLIKGGFKVRDCIFNYNSMETLANDISKLITGAQQANKGLYAIAFPFLMAIVFLGSLYRPRNDGSGLVALAYKEA